MWWIRNNTNTRNDSSDFTQKIRCRVYFLIAHADSSKSYRQSDQVSQRANGWIFCYPTSKMSPFQCVAAGIQIVAEQENTTGAAIESCFLNV